MRALENVVKVGGEHTAGGDDDDGEPFKNIQIKTSRRGKSRSLYIYTDTAPIIIPVFFILLDCFSLGCLIVVVVAVSFI